MMRHALPLLLLAGALHSQPSPNFIILMGEAQGWASTSEPLDDRHPKESQSDFLLTPNLDALARRGIRFSDFYAASPRCTPTRAALFTGRSPAQLGMTFVNEGGEGKKSGAPTPGLSRVESLTELPLGTPTMGSLLKSRGYRTAHFGKWHVGRSDPASLGYEQNDGANSNDGPEHVQEPNPTQAHAITRLGLEFIAEQARAKQPFLLQISHYPGRSPEAASAPFLEEAKARLGSRLDAMRLGLAAGNAEADATYGEIFRALRDHGLLENTYLIYTADHGAQGNRANGGLKMGKGSVWEGGLRVPLIVAGPQIKPNQFAHQRASSVDLLPTVLDLAGLPASQWPRGLEGSSLRPLFAEAKGAELKRAHPELLIHFPHHDKDPMGPASALLQGPWKLIHFYRDDQWQLYNLDEDLGETRDLAAAQPQRLAQLKADMSAALQRVKAKLPQADRTRPTQQAEPQPTQPQQGGMSKPGGKPGGKPGPQKKNRGMVDAGGGGATVEPAQVPSYLGNAWLCRPGADVCDLSLLAWQDLKVEVFFGQAQGELAQHAEVALSAGVPKTISLKPLRPNSAQCYQVRWLPKDGPPVQEAPAYFHTQRRVGEGFQFALQADSHLDTATSPELYQETLRLVGEGGHDFLIDLGDTTMVDKFGRFYTRAQSQYLAQRYYLGLIAHSLPVFMVLGNHDGERGGLGAEPAMAFWSLPRRKAFFPNPEPGGIYSGNDFRLPELGLLQNYFAWQWGDALFIALDPFWNSGARASDDPWSSTLGEAQYQWLTRTLEGSQARYLFVLIHHLSGGLQRDSRGGASAALSGEWGGRDAQGRDAFKSRRPGWEMPIHALLCKHRASAVFHGHDHLYAHEELEGLVYQEVPQPGHPGGNVGKAQDYGYRGAVLGSSGFVQVQVDAQAAVVRYIGSSLDPTQSGRLRDEYRIAPRR
jgi:arylsulfatase A-like enzyme